MFQKLSVQSSELVVKKMRIPQYKKNNPANPVILSKILRPFFSCFLCFSWLKLLSFMLLMSFMVNLIAEPTKIAIIGDTEKYQNQIDLLTVELSQDKNVHLLERTDIDYILKEHSIALSKVSQHSLKIGQLLGADGLIIVKEIEIDGKKFLSSRLVSVKSAVIVDASIFPLDEKSETANWAETIKWKFENSFAKLDVSKSDKISISLLNIRSPLSNLLREEKEFNILLSHNLMMEKRIFITERWNMGQVLFENELDDSSSEYVTGKSLIEGSLETIDEKNIKITLTIKKEGQSLDEKVVLTGLKTDLAKLAKNAVDDILKIMNVAKNTLSWNKEKEAEAYFREAQWGLNSSLYDVASAAADSAWALGSKDLLLPMLRIRSNGGTLFNQVAFNPTRFDYGIQSPDNAPRMESKNFNITASKLDGVIYSLEVYMNEVKKNSDFFRINRVDATTLFKYASSILKVAFEQKWNKNYKYSDKVTVLRYLTKKMFYLSMAQKPKSEKFNFAKQYFITIFFNFAAYLNETPTDTINDYKKVFKFDFNNESLKNNFFKMKIKYILKKRLSDAPWTIDWDANSKNLSNEFIEYVRNLLNSSNDEDIVNGAIIVNSDSTLKSKLKYSSAAIKDILIKNKDDFMNQIKSYSPYAILPLYCHDKAFLFNMAKEILTKSEKPNWAVIRKLLNKTSYSRTKLNNKEMIEFYNILTNLKQRNVGVFEESPTMKRLLVEITDSLRKQKYDFKDDIGLSDFLKAKPLFEISNKDINSTYINTKQIGNLLLIRPYRNTANSGFVIIDVINESKKVIKTPTNIGEGFSPMDITGNEKILICGFQNGDIARYDLMKNSWEKIKNLSISGYGILKMSVINNNLIITFGPGYRNKKDSNSGLFKLNLENLKLDLIASNRRLPTQTILDNTPQYRIYDMIEYKNSKIIMAMKFINVTESPYGIYEYDLNSNTLSKLFNQWSWRGMRIKQCLNSFIISSGTYGVDNLDISNILISMETNNNYPKPKNNPQWKSYYIGSRLGRSFCYNGKDLFVKNDPNDPFNSVNTVNNNFGGNLNLAYFAENKKYEKIIPIKLKNSSYYGQLEIFSDGSLIIISKNNNKLPQIYKISKKEFDDFNNKKLDRPVIFPTERDMHNKIYSTVHYFGTEQLIKISTNIDCEIRYTLDGSIPNENSILYTKPFIIKKATEIKAKAFKDGYYSSDFTKNIFKPEIANAKIYADWNNDGKDTLAIQFHDTWESGVMNRVFIDNDMDGQFDKGYTLPRKMLKYSNKYLALKTDSGAELAIFNSKTLYYGDEFKKEIKYQGLSDIIKVKGHNRGIAIFANNKWHIDNNLDGKIEQ